MKHTKKRRQGVLACAVLAGAIAALVLCAMKAGSLQVTWRQLFSGLFISYDETVALIYDMRFPRIIVALLSGGALAVSGLLFQSSLRNSLADPGIIGISGGAAFAASMVTALAPALFFKHRGKADAK